MQVLRHESNMRMLSIKQLPFIPRGLQLGCRTFFSGFYLVCNCLSVICKAVDIFIMEDNTGGTSGPTSRLQSSD